MKMKGFCPIFDSKLSRKHERIKTRNIKNNNKVKKNAYMRIHRRIRELDSYVIYENERILSDL